MIRSGMKCVNLIFLAGVLFASAACGSSPPENPSLDSRKADDPSQQVSSPMNLNGQIEFSKKDLARRLGIADELVVLSGARHVTWRSGALGCPDPGMSYTQALVPGTVIYLQVETTMHAYHARFSGEPFYCPRERVESPVTEGDDRI